MKEVRLKGGKYSLIRKQDGSGDSGPAWSVYDGDIAKSERRYQWLEDAHGLVRVGCGIRIGGITARSYSYQDWWQCSPVSEILRVETDEEGDPVEVEFKTGNSIYIAKSF